MCRIKVIETHFPTANGFENNKAFWQNFATKIDEFSNANVCNAHGCEHETRDVAVVTEINGNDTRYTVPLCADHLVLNQELDVDGPLIEKDIRLLLDGKK
jgi:hypothetical protein